MKPSDSIASSGGVTEFDLDGDIRPVTPPATGDNVAVGDDAAFSNHDVIDKSLTFLFHYEYEYTTQNDVFQRTVRYDKRSNSYVSLRWIHWGNFFRKSWKYFLKPLLFVVLFVGTFPIGPIICCFYVIINKSEHKIVTPISVNLESAILYLLDNDVPPSAEQQTLIYAFDAFRDSQLTSFHLFNLSVCSSTKDLKRVFFVGGTLLHIAARLRKIQWVNFFLQLQTPLDLLEKDTRNNPLHLIAGNLGTQALSELIDSLRGENGQSVLQPLRPTTLPAYSEQDLKTACTTLNARGRTPYFIARSRVGVDVAEKFYPDEKIPSANALAVRDCPDILDLKAEQYADRFDPIAVRNLAKSSVNNEIFNLNNYLAWSFALISLIIEIVSEARDELASGPEKSGYLAATIFFFSLSLFEGWKAVADEYQAYARLAKPYVDSIEPLWSSLFNVFLPQNRGRKLALLVTTVLAITLEGVGLGENFGLSDQASSALNVGLTSAAATLFSVGSGAVTASLSTENSFYATSNLLLHV